MAQRLLTESGNNLVMEDITGIIGASTLNDVSVVGIDKETFTSDPVARGWLVGFNWEWDASNGNMKIV